MKCKYYQVIIAVITVTIAILASLLIPGFQVPMFTGTYGHLLNNQIIMLGGTLFIFMFMGLGFGCIQFII